MNALPQKAPQPMSTDNPNFSSGMPRAFACAENDAVSRKNLRLFKD